MCADFNRCDIFKTNQALALFYHQAAEAFDGIEVGVDAHVGNHQRAFDLARGGLIIVLLDGPVDVGGSNAVSGHAQGVEPDTHRQVLTAKHVDGGHAFNGGQHGPGHAHQVVGDTRQGFTFAGAETGVNDTDRAWCLAYHNRVVGLFG
ncbi:hypothetical protein D3C85_1446380 [compost metagenome]